MEGTSTSRAIQIDRRRRVSCIERVFQLRSQREHLWVVMNYRSVSLTRIGNSPTRVKRCQEKSLTRSTSVVMRIMICALEEKSSTAGVSAAPSRVGPFFLLSSSPVVLLDPVEATSFRTRVLENRIELSCTRNLTWRVRVLIAQS